MKITKIETTKKGRYSLFLDDEFAFSVHKDTFLLSDDIQKDAELSPERVEQLREEDALRSAKEKAMDLLSAREYTAAMLRQKLRQFFEEEPAAEAVRRMEELGLVNDLDYATRLAADMVNLRHYPLRRIALELSKRGIDREMAASILSAYSEESQAEAVATVVRKKYKNSLSDRKGVDKTIAALLRRGFTMEDIHGGLSMVLEDLRQEELPEESEEFI